MYLEQLFERTVVSQLSVAIPSTITRTVRAFRDKVLDEERRRAIGDRRVELGYDRYDHRHVEGKKPFDQDAFDRHNEAKDWTPDQAVGDRLSEIVPKEGNSPVYALMGRVSQALTTIVQAHVTEFFGDPLTLAGGLTIPVSDIYVRVWWTQSPNTKESHIGLYSRRSSHIDGPRTVLTVVVDRDQWRVAFVDLLTATISSDSYDFAPFTASVTDTLVHEYGHLEHDIAGQMPDHYVSKGSLYPKGSRRKQSRDTNQVPSEELRHMARTAEQDTIAMGGAADVIRQIIAQYADNWSSTYIVDGEVDTGRIPAEDWNKQIDHAVRNIQAGEIPSSVKWRIDFLDDLLDDPLQATFNPKLLKALRLTLLRKLIRRVEQYRRAVPQRLRPGAFFTTRDGHQERVWTLDRHQPSDPNKAYVQNRAGRDFIVVDRGEGWVEENW